MPRSGCLGQTEVMIRGASPKADPATDPLAAARASAERLADITGVAGHDVAVVLGSGWRSAADLMGATQLELDLADLGGFATPGVEGHISTVRSIDADGRRILAFMGRVHTYEGHPPNTVVHGIRTAAAAGCRTLVLTNAAGGLRPGYELGQPVLIADHLNLTGMSPLVGPHDEALGPRFPDMTAAYSSRLRGLARLVDPSLVEGVYAGVLGPAYETPAEVEMLSRLGADLVGMSTVNETIAAVHAGLEVLGISLVTNLAAGLGPEALDHRDVLEVAASSAQRMGALVADVVGRL